MNGETTWDVEAQMLKRYGGMWRAVSVGRRTLDEADEIQKRFERGSDIPIRVVRVETTRTVEEGGGE